MQSTKIGDLKGGQRLVERQMLLTKLRQTGSRDATLPAATGRHRFITISRDLGALGNFIATELAGRLSWQVFDKEIVDCIAQDARMRHDLVQALDERAKSLIQDTVDRLLRSAEGVSFGSEEYHQALLKTLAALAARGEVILVGRGGTYALQGEAGLHLRITGSLDVRTERISKRFGITIEEARSRVQRVDADRRSFLLQHFRANVEDTRFYDMVFNTDRMSVGQVVSAVLGTIKESENVLPQEKGMPGRDQRPAQPTAAV